MVPPLAAAQAPSNAPAGALNASSDETARGGARLSNPAGAQSGANLTPASVPTLAAPTGGDSSPGDSGGSTDPNDLTQEGAASASTAAAAAGANANVPGPGAPVGGASNSGTLDPAATVNPMSAFDPANAVAGAGALNTAVLGLSGPHAGSDNVLPSQPELHATIGTAEWADELGGQLTWMAQHGIGTASIQISPPELGPIEVRVSVHGTQASVWFGAAQADTRSALEQALPRLHQLFGAQGLALADAGVSRESPRQQREASAATSNAPGAVHTPADSPAQGSASIQRLGLLDLYA